MPDSFCINLTKIIINLLKSVFKIFIKYSVTRELVLKSKNQMLGNILTPRAFNH